MSLIGPAERWLTKLGNAALQFSVVVLLFGIPILLLAWWDSHAVVQPSFFNDIFPNVISAYALVLLVVLLIGWVVGRIVRESWENGVFFGLGAMLLVAVFIATFPPGQSLSGLVDDECNPRFTLLPYAISEPIGFWSRVVVRAEDTLAGLNESIADCSSASDSQARQGCVDYRKMRQAVVTYCLRKASE